MIYKSKALQHLVKKNFRECSRLYSNEFIFIFNDVSHLTGFCIPSIKKMKSETCFYYEYGVMVVSDPDSSEEIIKRNIEKRNFLALSKILSPDNPQDTFVHGDIVSDWLVGDVLLTMDTLTLSCEQALSQIRNSYTDNYLFGRLAKFYKEKFIDKIALPLSKIKEFEVGKRNLQ